MESLIQKCPEWRTAKPEIILSFFTAPETRPKAGARYNGNDLQLAIGVGPANAFAKLLAGDYPLIIGALGSKDGIDFAHPRTQEMLVYFKSVLPKDYVPIIDALISLGAETKTRWEWEYDNSPLPTENDIAATVAKISQKEDIEYRIAILRTAVYEAISEIEQGISEDRLQVVTAFVKAFA